MRLLYCKSNGSKRWLSSCLLFFMLSCTYRSADTAIPSSTQVSQQNSNEAIRIIDSLSHHIRPGDLITRTGNDFTSYCLRQFCQTNKNYSHCGIASIENGSIFVYHALGGEFNPDQRLLRDPLQVFASSLANRGFGIFRFQMTNEQNRELLNQARLAFEKGIPFDMEFDLVTDNKMYCSEFTAKMYRRAFENDTMFNPSQIGSFVYLAPDNLFTHPLCNKLFEATFAVVEQ